jgi:NhaA family Na+:H+ antiporter
MANDIDPIHSTWLSSEKAVPSRFIRPVIKFTEVEAAGGILLLIAAAIALIWANSPLYESYFTLINTHLEFSGALLHVDETVKGIVNDGLMAVFFFVVG